MNVYQWICAMCCGSVCGFHLGRAVKLYRTRRIIAEYHENQMKEVNKLFDKISECNKARDSFDRIRFQQQTRANSN